MSLSIDGFHLLPNESADVIRDGDTIEISQVAVQNNRISIADTIAVNQMAFSKEQTVDKQFPLQISNKLINTRKRSRSSTSNSSSESSNNNSSNSGSENNNNKNNNSISSDNSSETSSKSSSDSSGSSDSSSSSNNSSKSSKSSNCDDNNNNNNNKSISKPVVNENQPPNNIQQVIDVQSLWQQMSNKSNQVVHNPPPAKRQKKISRITDAPSISNTTTTSIGHTLDDDNDWKLSPILKAWTDLQVDQLLAISCIRLYPESCEPVVTPHRRVRLLGLLPGEVMRVLYSNKEGKDEEEEELHWSEVTTCFHYYYCYYYYSHYYS